MMKKIIVIMFTLVLTLLPITSVFGEDDPLAGKSVPAFTPGIYSEGDLVLDRTTGVENVTGYDYIYGNPASSDKISITLKNTELFQLKRYYYKGGLHDCYMNSLIYTGGGFGDNTESKEIPGDIAMVRIADSVKNGAGDRFDLILLIKNLIITPDPAYCTRDPLVGVNLFYYQEKADPIISTNPTAYDNYGSTTHAPNSYGRYKVEYEYEFRVVMPGTDDNAPKGSLLYGSRDFDSYLEGYDIISGVLSGTNREEPTIYMEPDTITDVSYNRAKNCYRICGTVADENTWRSGFAALFDSTGSTLRWFGFRSLGTTIIGQEAYEFTKYYNVKGKIIRGEGSIDPVDVTVSCGMNVNCVIDPADEYYISGVRLYSVGAHSRETLVRSYSTNEVMDSDPFNMPITNIQQDYRYEVEFDRKYRIDLTVINGRAGDSDTESEASYWVAPGGRVDLTYHGNEGYVLKGMDVDGTQIDTSGHEEGYTFENVQADHHVTVTYGKRYTVSTAVTNGTITDDLSLWEGEDGLVEYSPDPGHHLSSVTVDGESQDISLYTDSYQFNDIHSDHSIEVVYVSNQTVLSKVDEYGDLLPGAELQLCDSEGTVLDEWTTTEDDHSVFSLAEGTYYLIEKSAPPGYLASEDVEFEVDREGNTIVGGVTTDKVVMVDVKMHGLPDTGSNGMVFHIVTLGVLLSMLSTVTMLTRRA